MFCGNVFLMFQLGDKLHLRRGEVSQVTQRDTEASSYYLGVFSLFALLLSVCHVGPVPVSFRHTYAWTL